MKKLIAVLATAIALSGCNSLTGPDDQEESAQAAKAKRNLEAATVTGPSTRLAGN